ncbi:MAG: BtrH N-terminal domain-containing protein [Paracoccaceae bacterium]
MTIISDYIPFVGAHCETTTMGNLLQHAGLPLSEPMIFGVGMGMGFGVFRFKGMPTPFIGGRVKAEEITKGLVKNLGLEADYKTTRSRKRAWDNIANFIDEGQPVAVKLDAYYLDYFDIDFHFAGHYLTVYGYDGEYVYVVDTDQQGGVLKTQRQSLEEGRLWKGPMASNALSWTIEKTDKTIEWPLVLRRAIASNAKDYLTPPIKNFGAKGIRKAAKMVPSWMDTIENPEPALAQLGSIMERAGTGGGLFRYMYTDFLNEAKTHLDDHTVEIAAAEFLEAANRWRAVSEIFESVSVNGLESASQIMLEIADLEEAAMSRLAELG